MDEPLEPHLPPCLHATESHLRTYCLTASLSEVQPGAPHGTMGKIFLESFAGSANLQE